MADKWNMYSDPVLGDIREGAERLSSVRSSHPAIRSQPKPLPTQGGDDGFDVGHVARFDNHVQFCLFERHRLHHALVDDFDDIGACLADDAGDVGELTGGVVDFKRQAGDAAVAH